MQIKFCPISTFLIALISFFIVACSGGSPKSGGVSEEALSIYNSSMATAEEMTKRLANTTNNLKILDARVRNEDTVSVFKLGQAYDDIENVKQLIKQWKRDVPRISTNPEANSTLPEEEMIIKQKEFQEKIDYIRFRLDDLDKTLNGMLQGSPN